ncbi:MAG: extracellular solute-binding protein, partial [Treponema sp.]|nr:extracellular solute-binding protein [Treponema sp.]
FVLPLFAGGSQSGGSTAGSTSRTGSRGSLPLAKNKPTLSMFIPGAYDDRLTSLEYKDNAFTKKVVDESGVNLVITSTNFADRRERLNIILNSGDYPDIIYTNSFPVDMEYYAKQGIFIPLDGYDPMSFPRIKRAFEVYPEAKVKTVGSDGKLYSLPTVEYCLHCIYQFGRIWYYMPWVRDNNRKVPETLNEFTDFLRFAKNNDPNKNGKKDEVGILLTSGDLYNLVAFVAKAYMPFVFSGGASFGRGLDSNKKVVEQYRDDNFRSALTYLAGLYQEGLIIPDGFSMNREQAQVIARSQDTIAPVIASTWYNTLVPAVSDKSMEYFCLPPLKTPTGARYAFNGDPWGTIYNTFFITDKCKDPELALALYDYFLTDDAQKCAYGPKGEFWTDPDPGAVGYDGQPAFWKWIQTYGNATLNSHWGNFSPHVWEAKMKAGIQMNDVDIAKKYLATGDAALKSRLQQNSSYPEFMWYNISMEASKYAIPTSAFIPPLLMSNADKTRYSDIFASYDPFMQSAIVEFITGVRDIKNNAHWNAYLAELDKLGSKELVQILQKYIK